MDTKTITTIAKKLDEKRCFPASCSGESPSRRELSKLMRQFRMVVFASYYCHEDNLVAYRVDRIERAVHILEEQLYRGICFSCNRAGKGDCHGQATQWTEAFLETLPELESLLQKDVEAAYKGDPAATSQAEIVLAYPSIEALLYYRVAHGLHRLGVPLIPRILAELAHSTTGIDIHPAATIGKYFFIDHGTGVVIGSTTLIGDHCRLYQGVTLGAASFKTLPDGSIQREPKKRHPTLEDKVVVYAEATILGDIVIGEGAVIGGNVWVTEAVEPGGRVVQQRCVGG